MDIILRGLIAGVTAAAVYTIINLALFLTGVVPSTLTHYSAVLVMPPGTPVTALALTMGAFADIATGWFAAVIIAFVLSWTGRDHAWLKGLGTGGVLWIVHVSFIPAVVPRVFSTLPPSMVVASLVLSLLWGLITGLILQYLPEQRRQPLHSD
jgi:hypothetical protein